MTEQEFLFDYKLLNKVNSINANRDFVGIYGNQLNGILEHSGLIICHEKQVLIFHYYNLKVELTNITKSLHQYEDSYFKKLEIISSQESQAFLAHCERIKSKGVTPKYGFIFNDSYYDSNIDNCLVNAKYDVTTCVGFCIKTIRGFLFNNSEYIKLDDWNKSSMMSLSEEVLETIFKYLDNFAKENGEDPKNVYQLSEIKRILPSELVSSGFIPEIPIKKTTIDPIKIEMESFIAEDSSI